MVNQIMMPITRLYAPIDELSIQSLAEHIGMCRQLAFIKNIVLFIPQFRY